MKCEKWIAYRDGDACGVFENREQAVNWLRGLLKQTLEDYEGQDKSGEFDYPIEIKRILIEPLKERKEHLGL